MMTRPVKTTTFTALTLLVGQFRNDPVAVVPPSENASVRGNGSEQGTKHAGTATHIACVHYLTGNWRAAGRRQQSSGASMKTLLGFPQTDTFGRLLRHWRTTRHMSQLALATEAGISTRHLSFLETGRAQPSREMVQLLTGMLDVPPGERNALLVSAGYAPVVLGEQPVGAPELEPVRRPLQFILNQQEPFPAIVLDGHWNIVMGNGASHRIFGLFKDRGDHDGANVMRSVFDPDRLRRFILNWEEVAQCLMHSLHRDVAATGGEGVVRLRDEVLAYPGVPSRWATADKVTPMPSLATMRMRKDDLTLSFFSTVTTFATPRDLTLQQLKIECFFPADTATEQMARRLAYRESVAV